MPAPCYFLPAGPLIIASASRFKTSGCPQQTQQSGKYAAICGPSGSIGVQVDSSAVWSPLSRARANDWAIIRSFASGTFFARNSSNEVDRLHDVAIQLGSPLSKVAAALAGLANQEIIHRTRVTTFFPKEDSLL